MLAENAIDWSREYKEEGRREILQALCPAVLAQLEQRFGSLTEEARRRVEAIDSAEELAELLTRLLSASSLADLGLAS
ncbi:MAG TPA: DUF4351 domain-containing protein [Thermoanaerobaculia bacterium]|jgi:hypothetical protein|nr:DUF4351 domain-containing protein [Thermoanaerobaculia bacterium]